MTNEIKIIGQDNGKEDGYYDVQCETCIVKVDYPTSASFSSRILKARLDLSLTEALKAAVKHRADFGLNHEIKIFSREYFEGINVID